MVRRAYTQRSLIEVLLPDSARLWDPILRQIDAVLDDDELVDRIAEALPRRHPQSRGRGRWGTPAAVVLRMLVLKRLHDWSFDECEREVRGSLVYRAFCRIDAELFRDVDAQPAAVYPPASPLCSVYHSLRIVPVGAVTLPRGHGPRSLRAP